MTDESAPADPRAQGAAFLASWDEIVAEARMLRIEHSAMVEQIQALTDELTRVRGREQALKAQLDAALYADTASKNLLEDLARRLLAGMKVIRPEQEMRGRPFRVVRDSAA